MAMSGDNADRVQRDYRAANEALDERPSAATRASILAAAARQVQAGPRDAAAPIAAPKPGMRRWPMAAAAAVMLSTLAVMMAVRTEHEMPTFTPPTGSDESRAAAARAPVAPGVESGSATDKSAGEVAAAATQRAPALAKERTAKPAAVTPAAAPPSSGTSALRDVAPQLADSKVTAPVGEPRAKEEVAGLRAPASPPPAPSAAAPLEAKRAAPSPSAGSEVAAAESAAPGVDRERRRDGAAANLARAPARQAPAVGGALGAAAEKPRAEGDAAANELRAEDWLEKIIKLRQTGRHEEADAELKRFRERYPHVQVPAAALPPSGTR
jgi:ribonuclease E